MALERRIRRLEAARSAGPAPEVDAAFAALADALDRLAARKAAGDAGAAADLEALAAAVRHGRA